MQRIAIVGLVLVACGGPSDAVDAGSDGGDVVAACAGPAPALSACTGGVYDLDCGGSGPAVIGCSSLSARCFWFATSCMPADFVASDCPASHVCCHASGSGTWAFPDGWHPQAPALTAQTVEDLAMLGGRVVSRTSPATIEVAIDPSIAAPAQTTITCDPSIDLELCSAPIVTYGVLRQSLLFAINPTRVDRQHTTLELVPSGAGTWIARAFVVVEQDAENGEPTTPRCELAETPVPAPTFAGQLTLSGTTGTNIHGHAELTVNGAPATIVF